LSSYLTTINSEKIIVGGDFNINLFLEGEIIRNFCSNFNLTPKINSITRADSGTCIDNFLSSLDGIYEVTDISIADHFAISAKIAASFREKQTHSYTYRQMKENNFIAFNHRLYQLEVNGNTIEDKWGYLQSSIKQIVDDSFPIKTGRRKYIFTMSAGLLKSRDKKNKLLKQYKQGRIDKSVYTNYNNIYRKLIRKEQSHKFKEELLEAGLNGKKKWRVIKSHLHLEKSISAIDSIKVDGRTITDQKQIAEAFKEHFSSCASKLADGLPPGEDTSTIMQNGDNWSFKRVTVADTLKIIRSLKNKNSAGIDGLSNRMIKKEAYRFAVLMTPLINESLTEGKFPDCLKIANIIPIFKKGDPTDMNNYRPIALLPVMSKVFEKVINLQLNKVVEEKFIDDNQYGFRSGFSTEDAAIKFANEIEKELRANKHVVSIYVDVSKAFDSCDHQIILTKIAKTGLDPTGLALMKSYLLDRKQNVCVNNVDGGNYLINLGVGQGTILGPTLFKIYIMDLHLHTKLFCIKFADDSNFLGSARTRDEVTDLINEEMAKVHKWFSSNRLTLHPNKSRFIVHSSDKLVDLFIGGCRVMRCGYGLQEEGVKFLGLYVDENLDWKLHINNVTKKISKGTYILWRHKKMNINIKKLIYESFVRCHLLYCLTVWGGASSPKLKPLITQLKKTWKLIGKYKDHTLTRLRTHNILKIEDELLIQESKVVWRWEKKILPKALMNLIVEKNDNLRRRRFVIPRGAVSSISSRLNRAAESNIATVSLCKTKKTLSNKLKKSIITSKYNFNCTRRGCFICADRIV